MFTSYDLHWYRVEDPVTGLVVLCYAMPEESPKALLHRTYVTMHERIRERDVILARRRKHHSTKRRR